MRLLTTLVSIVLLPATIWLAACIRTSTAVRVVEDTFDAIKNTGGEQLVAFYHGRDSSFKDTLKIMKKAAKVCRYACISFLFDHLWATARLLDCSTARLLDCLRWRRYWLFA